MASIRQSFLPIRTNINGKSGTPEAVLQRAAQALGVFYDQNFQDLGSNSQYIRDISPIACSIYLRIRWGSGLHAKFQVWAALRRYDSSPLVARNGGRARLLPPAAPSIHIEPSPDAERASIDAQSY